MPHDARFSPKPAGESAPNYNAEKTKTCTHSFMRICGCPWVCRHCGISFEHWAHNRIFELEQQIKKGY